MQVVQIPEEWMNYAQVASLVVIVFLCILLFFMFRSNLKIVLLLVGITIVLSSANLFLMCWKLQIQFHVVFFLDSSFWRTYSQ
uniref:Uncharacterized protein n=1 Tax=Trichobilharzia regenti TaxID=157069 RepID=A0AA85J664_TRIRE|nr:unnamed protein product [Trichobilharzia regenti]